MPFWSVPADPCDEVTFIVGGGTSVIGQPLDRLRGRRIIVINSSFEAVPFANYLFFGDLRWWLDNRAAVLKFAGTIVTTESIDHLRVMRLRKLAPPDMKGTPRTGQGWLSDRRDCLAMGWTSLIGALGLARLLGWRHLALLGIDLKAARDGRSHHHRPHRHPQMPGCWAKQMGHLKPLAAELKADGMEIVNCSPISRAEWWPYRDLEDLL